METQPFLKDPVELQLLQQPQLEEVGLQHQLKGQVRQTHIAKGLQENHIHQVLKVQLHLHQAEVLVHVAHILQPTKVVLNTEQLQGLVITELLQETVVLLLIIIITEAQATTIAHLPEEVVVILRIVQEVKNLHPIPEEVLAPEVQNLLRTLLPDRAAVAEARLIHHLEAAVVLPILLQGVVQVLQGHQVEALDQDLAVAVDQAEVAGNNLKEY